METGTLKDLNVQPGDVVEDTSDRKFFEVRYLREYEAHGRTTWPNEMSEDDYWSLTGIDTWRIVSRASDAPKPWSDMTDEERTPILLHWSRGGEVEYFDTATYKWCEDDDFEPFVYDDVAYRAKPAEPMVKTVTLYGSAKKGMNRTWGFSTVDFNSADTHTITLTLRDGIPDPVAKVEPIETP